MKKLAKILTISALFAVLAVPMVVLGQQNSVGPQQGLPESCWITNSNLAKNGSCPGSGQECRFDNSTYNCSMCCLLNSISIITNWLFYILTLIAVVFFIWGGFIYLTSGGNPEKTKSGQNILVFGIIGLAIALIAKLVPAVVRFIVGM